MRRRLSTITLAAASATTLIAPLPADAAPPTYSDPRPKMVTLGDSYMSGTGIWAEDSSYDQQFGGLDNGFALTGRSDQECWRETDSTPGPRRAAATNSRSIFLACKGAEVSHVANQLNLLQAQWPADAAIKWSGSTFIVTGGGNDIRTGRGEDWPSLIERCILEVNPFSGCHANSQNQVTNWSSIRLGLTAHYTNLAAAATNAKIRVMGYPRVMRPFNNWLGVLSCPLVTGITGNEARWMDQQVDQLNVEIQAAVNAAKAAYPSANLTYVSVANKFPVGACANSQSSRYINDRVTAWSGSGVLLTSDASFHPTQKGYNDYYDAFIASL
jgi:GDSL-like Lipase/Acylhydrolase family